MEFRSLLHSTAARGFISPTRLRRVLFYSLEIRTVAIWHLYSSGRRGRRCKETKQLEYAQRATLRATTVLVAGPAPCAAVIVLRRRSLQVRRTNNHIHISSRCRRRPDRFMNRGPSSATLPYPPPPTPRRPRVPGSRARARVAGHLNYRRNIPVVG